MKKKIIIVISVLAILLLALGGIFLIDKNRMDNNKPVIFSTWGYDYVPPEEKENITETIQNVEPQNRIVTIPVKEKEDLVITLLDDWKYEVSGEVIDEYKYAIKFYKSDENKKMTLYSYANFFGVCGTGLEMKKLELEDGNIANVGFYDGNEKWSFITFDISEEEIVAHNEGLTLEESNEALSMFKTLKLIKTLPGNIAVTERSFIATIIEEEPTYLIVEPNDGEIEKQQSKTKKILIADGESREYIRDYIYGVGRKVIITYNPVIQSDTNVISGAEIDVDGYDDFEITVVESENAEKKKVLNNRELDKLNSDYDLYYYGLDEVNVKVNNKEMTFENALREGYITLTGLLTKANRDGVEQDSYDDGGSKRFHYEDYTIIKYNTIDGNHDLYICPPGTSINDLNK